MIVVDTSVILAYMDARDRRHAEVSAWLEQDRDDLVTTPLVVAEADHLVGARGGAAALASLRADLVSGAYLVDWWPEAMTTSARVAEQYAESALGLTDASLVALADHRDTTRIATLDETALPGRSGRSAAARLSRFCPRTASGR